MVCEYCGSKMRLLEEDNNVGFKHFVCTNEFCRLPVIIIDERYITQKKKHETNNELFCTKCEVLIKHSIEGDDICQHCYDTEKVPCNRCGDFKLHRTLTDGLCEKCRVQLRK